VKWLLLLFLIGFTILPLASWGQPIHYSRGLLFNVTTSRDLVGYDPKYYSFEAFSIHPPNVTPIRVVLAKNITIGATGLTPIVRKVDIPKGNYSLILLNISINETNGTQFDRAAYVFVNGVPVFWGSTQEILNSTAESDLTLFENLLQGNVTFQIVIPNFIDNAIGITGIYKVNATLYLYPGPRPQGLPNQFIPLFLNSLNYSYIVLNPTHPSYSESLNIPNGTYRDLLLLYEEGGGNDEFWYTNEPATRSILVRYDSLLAGVVNPYETIYTGGIDLFAWKPLTSINTLSFHTPYLMELTPLLALGLHPTLSLTVSNLQEAKVLTGSNAFDWDLAGVLLLWVNSSNPLMSANFTRAMGSFMDSSPIFQPGFSGTYYQENGHYSIEYASVLKFLHGSESSAVTQRGTFEAFQQFNTYFQYAQLDENFYESSSDTGMYNASMIIEGSFPITFNFVAFETPITSPTVIPFNATYVQNGTITLGLSYYSQYIFGKYNATTIIHENETSIGGFAGVLEIINQYGGAVLVSLTSNNALTTKSLIAYYLINGGGYEQSFLAQGLQNSTSNTSGYLIHLQNSYTTIN